MLHQWNPSTEPPEGFIPWPCLYACYTSGIRVQSPWGFIPWPCLFACYTSGIPVQSPWGFIPWPYPCACYTSGIPVQTPWSFIPWPCLCACYTSGIPVQSPWGFIPWPYLCACYTSGIPVQSPSHGSQTSLSVEGSVCQAGRSDTHSEPWCDNRDWTVCLNDRSLKWDQKSGTLTFKLQKILIVYSSKLAISSQPYQTDHQKRFVFSLDVFCL